MLEIVTICYYIESEA